MGRSEPKNIVSPENDTLSWKAASLATTNTSSPQTLLLQHLSPSTADRSWPKKRISEAVTGALFEGPLRRQHQTKSAPSPLGLPIREKPKKSSIQWSACMFGGYYINFKNSVFGLLPLDLDHLYDGSHCVSFILARDITTHRLILASTQPEPVPGPSTDHLSVLPPDKSAKANVTRVQEPAFAVLGRFSSSTVATYLPRVPAISLQPAIHIGSGLRLSPCPSLALWTSSGTVEAAICRDTLYRVPVTASSF